MRIFDKKNATPFSSFCKKTQVKSVCLLKQCVARCCADHKRILPILGGQQFGQKDYPLLFNEINTKKCFLVFKGKSVTLASFLTKITGDRAKKRAPFPRFLKKNEISQMSNDFSRLAEISEVDPWHFRFLGPRPQKCFWWVFDKKLQPTRNCGREAPHRLFQLIFEICVSIFTFSYFCCSLPRKSNLVHFQHKKSKRIFRKWAVKSRWGGSETNFWCLGVF